MCGLLSELSFTIRVPVRVPVLVGEKKTVKSQTLLAGPPKGGTKTNIGITACAHRGSMVKSPVVVMLETVSGTAPALMILRGSPMVVVTGVSRKVSEAGSNPVAGALGEPDRPTSCGDSSASFW